MQQSKDNHEIDRESNGDPKMTLNTIQVLCRKDLLPQSPLLNDRLYLMEKGFKKIDALSQFSNLVSLWLNNNLIERIENLNGLRSLVCLYLNNNKISTIQNLDQLQQLQILNLENNQIKIIEGLENLHSLKNLNVAFNLLSTIESVQHVKVVKNLTNLDLSGNQIENTQEIYGLISSLSDISCLYLKTTPFARGFKNYRKKIISALPCLKFLDDRPVQESDHRLCQAWLAGGLESEKQLRLTMQKQQANRTNSKYQTDEFQSSKFQQPQLIKKVDNLSKTKDNQRDNYQEGSYKTLKKVQTQKKQIANINSQFTYDNLKEQEKNIEQLTLVNEIKQDGRSETYQNWKGQYQPILQALLEKYKFNFSQVQPQFNMIIANINKKLCRNSSRFEIQTLQKIWTGVEKRKRETTKI